MAVVGMVPVTVQDDDAVATLTSRFRNLGETTCSVLNAGVEPEIQHARVRGATALGRTVRACAHRKGANIDISSPVSLGPPASSARDGRH